MRLLRALLAASLATACTPPDDDLIDDGIVVPDGKDDDFLTLSAREYIVTGRSFVTVEEGQGLECATELIKLKHVAIAWFLNEYLVDDESDTGAVSGFGAMVKTGRYEDLDIRQLNARSYEFTFEQQVAGRADLIRRLPLDRDGVLTLEIGKPTNEEMAQLETNDEWYRESPWSPWKPETQPASKKETLELTIRRVPPTADAWWDFERLIEDDVLSIDVHYGWDYHDALHLTNSWKLYRYLVNDKGFDTPVTYWEDYTRTSPPLTRVIEADGRDITVEVRIFYGREGTDVDPDTDAGGRRLENDMRESLRTRDVIVYEGHSGPFYGFALANWRKTEEGDLDDSEMPTVDMPADKYQIVFAEGCDTFMIGPAFLDNVNKQGKNIDVITTTTFSDAAHSPVGDFIKRLIELDSVGRHRPRPIRDTLADLDPAAMYGVHGVEDNPRIHPYAELENLCISCSTGSDCGGPGNACIGMLDGSRHCAAACTDDAACPDGYRCRSVASESSRTIFAKMCVPTRLVCE